MTRPAALPVVVVAAALLTPTPGAAGARAKDVRAKAFRSCAELIGHARRWERRTGGRVWAPVRGTPAQPVFTGPAPGGRGEQPTAVAQPAPAADSGSFSTTNNQEEGVDEPDVVKTDGRRILVASGGVLHVVSVDSPRVLGSLRLPGGSGHELILHGNRVLVLSRTVGTVAPAPSPPPDQPVQPAFAPSPAVGSTRIDEVDASNPAALRVVRTLQVDGDYVSARRNGDTARVVISSSPYAIAQPAAARAAAGWLPRSRLAVRGRKRARRLAVGCRAVRRPASFSGLGMLTVLTIDLDRGLPAVDSDALMSDAQIVYGSPKSLYVATQRWVNPGTAPDALPPSAARTALHRFDASAAGTTEYRAGGEVAGYLLNQFSLSEHRGVLRAATTEEPVWANGNRARESESFVTVVDQIGSRLVQVGRVGGLGRGERIYSVRFLGDTGYVVTFRQVDPLYTLDLERPAAPRVVGELKLLGYSAYLHPVGAGRLLGVGQDATEEGRTQGAQVVLFDVSDLRAPAVLGKLGLGRSSSSGVEFDHKAFLHWAPARLAVVPVRTYGPEESDRFAGAVAVRVEATGLREAGRIQHEAGGRPGDGFAPETPPAAEIVRSLVAGGRLFTLSDRGLLGSDLSTLGATAWVPFGTAP